jgi:hypothetical protein
MQNEPNLPNKQKRIMKNEPNFTTRKQTNTNTVSFFTTIFSKKIKNFTNKSKIIKKNTFCKFQTQTHLSPYIPRVYKAFCPLFFAVSLLLFNSFSITFTLFLPTFHSVFYTRLRVLSYPSRPSRPISPSDIHNTIYAIRDYLCKINPIANQNSTSLYVSA